FFSKKCSCTIVVLLSWLVHIVARAHCPCSTKQGVMFDNCFLVHEICVESILIITTWDM
ncbi:unnamed protein product, partial [Ixodes pacificus]